MISVTTALSWGCILLLQTPCEAEYRPRNHSNRGMCLTVKASSAAGSASGAASTRW